MSGADTPFGYRDHLTPEVRGSSEIPMRRLGLREIAQRIADIRPEQVVEIMEKATPHPMRIPASINRAARRASASRRRS